MKRKSSEVSINAPKDAVTEILEDVQAFITNWPYVVRVSTKEGFKAEIMMPRFIFKFRDTYTFNYQSDYNSHIYEGVGKRGHLTLVVTVKDLQKTTDAVLELSYQGKGEFWLGKTLQDFVNRIGKVLKELAENRPIVEPPAEASQNIAEKVDFADPMSVANFLSKSRMVHSGLHVIGEEGVLSLVGELRSSIRDRILYISGITSDGSSSFKLLLDGSRILALEYRGTEGIQVIKVQGEEDSRKAVELVAGIKGPYMVNVWVPVGGV